MTGDDVPAELLRRVVGLMPVAFRTKDASEHPEMRAGLARFVTERQYHAVIGRRLSDARGILGISETAKGGARGSGWEKVVGRPAAPVSPGERAAGERPGLARVRDGHRRAVEALAAPSFADVVALFDRYPEIGGTYFRPVDRGIQPVDLDPTSPKPLIGVGPAFPASSTTADLAGQMPARLAELRAKRSALSPSGEKVLEAASIAGALRAGLRLDDLDPAWRFVSSQWRLDVGGVASLPDILAVEAGTGAVIAVELKAAPDPLAAPQVAAYVRCLARSPDLLALIGGLARAMAGLYGCDDLVLEVAGGVRGYVAWPEGGRLRVHPA